MLKFLVVLAGIVAGIFCDATDASACFLRKKGKQSGCSASYVQQDSCGGCGSSAGGYSTQSSYQGQTYGQNSYPAQQNGYYQSQPGMYYPSQPGMYNQTQPWMYGTGMQPRIR